MKDIAIDIFNAALDAVNPYESVRLFTDHILSTCRIGHFNNLFIVSFGKAAFPMTQTLVESFNNIITRGIVITKYGHSEKDFLGDKIKIYEAGHPVPDERGFIATKKIIDMLKSADQQTLVICLISGGGSALLVAPYDDISLDEKQTITHLLLQAGADIVELNTVRKHISHVKGGRLAEIAYPAKVVSLILSDVIGDRLDVIASGPTSPDETTYKDALQVVGKYNLTNRIPQKVLHILMNGEKGNVPETPKRENPIFKRVENIIVGSNQKATESARVKASEHGFETTIITSEIQGEAREVGRWLGQKAIEILYGLGSKGKVCLISGGETTVTVRGKGLGGRNMELALSFAIEIDGIRGITLLSAGTDGTDGPTDAAGAIVNGQTIKKAREDGLDPGIYLENNDSYNFFKKIGGLFITGPTGTNVMDIQIILIDSR